MAGMDRFEGAERGVSRPPRKANLAWLAEPTTWFGLATLGMIIVFGGLGVDAYKHNHSTTEESLLSFSNPGHLIAAIGLALTSVSAVAGLTLAALRGTSTAEHAVRRLAPVTVAVVALVAVVVGSGTYMAATGASIGHTHLASTSALTPAQSQAGSLDAGGVAAALKQGGIDLNAGGGAAPGSSNDAIAAQAGQVPGSLTQGSNGAASGHAQHDHGKQPTFTQVEAMSASQLLPLFPPNTISETDFPTWKSQVEAVHDFALKFASPEDAKKAGYINTTSDVPYMGEHYLNLDLLRKGVFDPAHPTGLLYSKVGPGGAEQLVGVWFLLVPGINGVTRDTEPQGFAGNLDLWHAHTGLCLVGLSGASEGETKESCTAKGGAFTADLRWMMHVWVAPLQENPDGVFAYLNGDLFAKQQAAGKSVTVPTGNTPQ